MLDGKNRIVGILLVVIVIVVVGYAIFSGQSVTKVNIFDVGFEFDKPDTAFTVLYDVSGSAIPYGRADVDVAGQSVNLAVDGNRRKDSKNIRIKNPGTYSYHVILQEPLGPRVFKGGNEIEIKNGDIFEIQKGLTTSGTVVWLSKVEAPTTEDTAEEEELIRELEQIQ